jgi:sulfate adenylyltransferase (ADP) / ATP adenylyltransferase
VLNKYPVIPNHSILSTVGFERQTDFLDNEDLDVTYACLQAWEAESMERPPSRLFAFFNSGEHSGASQPHRHLQLLPVEDMMDPNSSTDGWQPLIDLMTEPLPDNPSILRAPSISFCHYAMDIPENPESGVLKRIYQRLYDSARMSVQAWNQARPRDCIDMEENSAAPSISYNLAMTTRTMAICPRRNETAVIPTTDGNGSAAVNGTILGGTMMVKEKSEWEALQRTHLGIDDILAEVGLPTTNKSDGPPSTRL